MRYLVLAGDNYYPAGGYDAVSSSDDILTALIRAKACLIEPINGSDKYSKPSDWSHVVDTDTTGLVWSSTDDN